jgi:hypothetical protein
VDARGLKAFVAEDPDAVGEGERHDDEIALLQGADVGADGLRIAIASWPIMRPLSPGSMVLYGQRSLQQIQARLTRTTASVGSTIVGSGTSRYERPRPGT